MPSTMRCVTISLSLVLCLHAPTAEAARRAAWRYRVDVAGEQPGDEQLNLPVRVYRLDYVKSKDILAIVKPLLSTSGTVSVSSGREVGGAIVVAAAPSPTGGKTIDIVIVRDHEEVLKKIEHVIAQVDVKPPEVLIEAQLIRVNLNNDYAHSGVNFAFLASGKKASPINAGNGKINGAAVQFRPVSAASETGKAAKETAADSNGVKIGFIGDNTAGFVRGLDRFGEPAVLGAPRLLVLNKQSAEVYLGNPLGYQKTIVTPTATIREFEQVNLGTELHVRPFVSSDRMVRLEVKFTRTTGGLDSQSIPQTDSEQIQTNMLLPDGTSVVACGSVRTGFIRLVDLLPSMRSMPYLGRILYDFKWFTGPEQLVVLISARVYGGKTDSLSPQPQPLAAAAVTR
jgi:type II secretory pathway component GspD/PulD (secretin)